MKRVEPESLAVVPLPNVPTHQAHRKELAALVGVSNEEEKLTGHRDW